jgi:ACS family glucarate transporter-like MFS transporter
MRVERRSRVRIFLAFWLFVLSGVAFVDRTNISIAGLQISAEYAIDNQHLGWIFSAFLIGYAGFQVPAGWLAVRFGPRRVLTWGVIWWAVTTVVMAVLPQHLSHPLLTLLLIRFALGAGESVVYPAANQFVARWIPIQERGLVNGLIFAGVGAGSGLTPPLLIWLIAHDGWRSAFWFSAAIGLVAGLVWWVTSRDTPEEHSRISAAELVVIRQGIVASAELNEAAKKQLSGISWSAMLRRRDLAALALGYFCFGYIAWIYFSWFFLYLAQVRHFSLSASASYSTLPFIAMTVGCLAGGALSDLLSRRFGLRVGRCALASASLFATMVFLLLGSRLQDPRTATLILSLGAGSLYLSQSSFWSSSIDIAGSSAGIFSSIVNIGGQLGGAMTASLTPWVAAHFGWSTSFGISAALAAIGAVCWLLVHPERPLENG